MCPKWFNRTFFLSFLPHRTPLFWGPLPYLDPLGVPFQSQLFPWWSPHTWYGLECRSRKTQARRRKTFGSGRWKVMCSYPTSCEVFKFGWWGSGETCLTWWGLEDKIKSFLKINSSHFKGNFPFYRLIKATSVFNQKTLVRLDLVKYQTTIFSKRQYYFWFICQKVELFAKKANWPRFS